MLGDRPSLLDAQRKLLKNGMRVNAMCVLNTMRGAFYSGLRALFDCALFECIFVCFVMSDVMSDE